MKTLRKPQHRDNSKWNSPPSCFVPYTKSTRTFSIRFSNRGSQDNCNVALIVFQSLRIQKRVFSFLLCSFQSLSISFISATSITLTLCRIWQRELLQRCICRRIVRTNVPLFLCFALSFPFYVLYIKTYSFVLYLQSACLASS